MARAVFLDRDDTLIACNSLPPPAAPGAPGDLVDPTLVRLLPGVLWACEMLKGAGFMLVVVSNQGCVARGAATLAQVRAVNDRVAALLTADGGGLDGSLHGELIDAVYFCPFHPKGTVAAYAQEHHSRKPQPGMLLQAAEELNLSLGECWIVGDSERDVAAGVAAGLPREQCLLIGDGRPLPDLLAAAELILSGLPLTTVTLRLHEGVDAAERVRSVVLAAAHGLAERFDLQVSSIGFEAGVLRASLFADEVTAVGFAAELRRNTGAWYEGKYRAGPLWHGKEGA